MTAIPIRILILVANPFDTAALTLDEEYQRIHNLWRSCDLRDSFEVHHCLATRAETLQSEVLQFKPHLIHFSGHGTEDSVIFTDSTGYQTHEVSKSALANLFKLCAPDLKAVFLNACHSAINAEDITEQVDYFIGMNDAIDDKAGTVFSQGFYSAIFNHDDLDIEQAFKAGLNQMAIARIANAEQQLRVLQKRPKTYVPSYKHDIFISFADADTQWATNFISELQKQLKSKLATFDDFQLCINNDFSQLEPSAMLLIIASPAYCQQYASQFEQLGNYAKRQPTFLIEMTSYSIPSSLTGVSRQKFWHDDEQQGILSLQGAAHIDKANQVAELVAQQLQDLKTKHQLQQLSEQHRQQQQAARSPDTKSIDAFIFLHSAPEDLALIADIESLLKDNGIDYVLPLHRSVEISSSDIRQDIENNILNCDAILILYEQTTSVWVREQLGNCRRLQRKRDTPLKIIAVHKGKEKQELNYQLDNLHIYNCPPENAATYLTHFMEKLA